MNKRGRRRTKGRGKRMSLRLPFWKRDKEELAAPMLLAQVPLNRALGSASTTKVSPAVP